MSKMDKTELKKNKLDLEYKFESQKALLFLTVGTISLLGFVATMMSIGKYTITAILGFVILIISLVLYKRKEKKLKNLLKKIEKL